MGTLDIDDPGKAENSLNAAGSVSTNPHENPKSKMPTAQSQAENNKATAQSEAEGSKATAPEEAVKVARHVTWVGFWINAVLALAKVIGGVVGRSSALIADGIHSLSDFVSDIIVIIMVGIARKRPDSDHPFGHGRFEALASVMLAVILIIVAIGIMVNGINNIIVVANGGILPRPGSIALIIILASIFSKEWLFHYTRRAGRRIRSDAVIANAWHHRSDAFSSVATFIGVTGAMFLGEKWRVLDPLSAIVVALFIIGVAIEIARPSLREMLGASLPKKDLDIIGNTLDNTPGIRAWHHLRTFKSGNEAYVEVHIKVDPDITVRHAHNIATEAEHSLSDALDGLTTHVTTHIEPYNPGK